MYHKVFRSSAPPGTDAEQSPRLTLRLARAHLWRSLLTLVGYAVFGLLVLKLVPGLEQAFTGIERVSWQWVIAALGLEIASEMGYVMSWKAIVDPEDRLALRGGPRMGMRLAWAQLGGGTLIPAGSFGSLGIGGWILHRLGMPGERIAERLLSLSFLNTATDALALLVFGLALAMGALSGENDPVLTLLPAALAAAALVVVLLLARRAAAHAAKERASHPRRAASVSAVTTAIQDTDEFIFHGVHLRGLLGAVAYLGFDVAVLWTAFPAVHADHAPGLGPVMMAYIIGALGGSIPFLPAGVGAIVGMTGMLILYGAHRDDAVAAVVVYQAVALLVPLAGGLLAFLLVRRYLSRTGEQVA
ncbi:MAG: lysylphosphatidylglycerol synthase domain-containing protein [Solirubrobacteraceae bacterium]